MNIKCTPYFLGLIILFSFPLYGQGDCLEQCRINSIIQDVTHFKPWKGKKVFHIFPVDINSYAVVYLQETDKIIFTPADTVGSNFIQFEFKEDNEKLFLWIDSRATVTQGLINILEQYGFIDKRVLDREWYIGEGMIDDGSRSLQYWFCPSSSTKYARRYLSPPFQRFFNNNRKAPPKLKCN